MKNRNFLVKDNVWFAAKKKAKENDMTISQVLRKFLKDYIKVIPLFLLLTSCCEYVQCVYCEKDGRVVVQCSDEVSNWDDKFIRDYWREQGFVCAVGFEEHCK